MATIFERLQIIVDASTKGAVRGLNDVSSAATRLQDRANLTANEIKALELKAQQASQTLRAGLAASAGVAGAALVAGFAAATVAATMFAKAMSSVEAVVDASPAQMEALSKAALTLGRSLGFTATEAAHAEAELAKAGVPVADILGGALQGTLALAAAGEIAVGEAAVVAAQALNIFGLRGAEATHVADVLAAGASKSATDVQALGESLRQGGLVAAQTGLSLEETVGALSLFSQNALTASDAGTSLKTFLQRLTPQSKESKAMMDLLGFSAYDAQGNFIGLANVAGELQEAFGKLTPEARNTALGTIFGTDAVRAATVFYEGGVGAVNHWSDAVDVAGEAARQAAIKQDNLAGDLKKLRGAFEAALIGGGSGSAGTLRVITQGTTSAVNALSEMPPAVAGTATALVGLGGVVLTTAAAYGFLAPKIRLAREALEGLGVAGMRASTAIGFIGKAGFVIGGAVVAFTAVAAAVEYMSDKVHDGVADVGLLTEALVDLFDTGDAVGELKQQFGDVAGIIEKVAQTKSPDLGVLNFLSPALDALDTDMKSAKKDLSSLDQALSAAFGDSRTRAGAVELWKAIRDGAAESGISLEEVRRVFPSLTSAMAAARTEGKLTGDALGSMGQKLAAVAPTIDDARSVIESLISTQQGLTNASHSVATAGRSVRDARENLNDVLGRGVDVTRRIEDAERGLVDSARDLVDAQEDLIDARERLNKVLAGPTNRERKQADLDVRQADLNLQQAQQRVVAAEARAAEARNPKRKGRFTSPGDADEHERELTDAELNLAEAVLAVEQAEQSQIDAREEANKVNNKGKRGSEDLERALDDVERAERRVTDATRQQAAAQRSLDEANEGVAEHEREIRDAREKVADASFAAARAREALTKATLDARRAHEAENELIATGLAGLTLLRVELEALVGLYPQLQPLLDSVNAQIDKEFRSGAGGFNFGDYGNEYFANGGIVAPGGIPRNAYGKIYDKATLGVFGEDGPEMILPLSKGKRSQALGLLAQSGLARDLFPAFANGAFVGSRVSRDALASATRSIVNAATTFAVGPIYASGRAEGHAAGDAIVDRLVKWQRRNGPVPIRVSG